MLVQPQYLMDVLTISSSYEEDNLTKVADLEVIAKDIVKSSVAIKAATYGVMSLVVSMKFNNPTSAINITDSQANMVRRAYLHLYGNISNSAFQETFRILKNSQVLKFESAIKSEEFKKDVSPLDAFKAWIVDMNNNRC